MKQAQADADSLIAAYRLEQQDAFDASSVGEGEFPLPHSIPHRGSRLTTHPPRPVPSSPRFPLLLLPLLLPPASQDPAGTNPP